MSPGRRGDTISISETLTGEDNVYQLDEEEKKKQEILTKRTAKLSDKKKNMVTLDMAAQRFNAHHRP